MYQVGEYIVHPGQGVCKVDEIVGEAQETYMLLPLGARNQLRISFPVASGDRLRPVLTREEAERLVDEYPQIEPDSHVGRSIALEEDHFRKEIRYGTCRDSLRIAKTFLQRIADVRARNKRPPVAYERILKQAFDRSLAELAVALGTTPDGVRELFVARGIEGFAAS